MIRKKLLGIVLCVCTLLSATGCGNAGNQSGANDAAKTTADSTAAITASDAAAYNGKLELDHALSLSYAKNFTVDCYKGGYKMIQVKDGKKILVVPEGMKTPEGIDTDTIILNQPVTNLLVSSTPATSLIHTIGCLDRISLTTTEKDSWYIDDVKTAMDSGKIKYAGIYTALDYELITATGTKFAVFSSMLPDDAAAQLEQLGVDFICDQSSTEDHPLGRVEWIKLYGALFDKESEAEAAFAKQESVISDIAGKPAVDKTVAIFYITSKGGLYARNSEDYMAKMVKLAGGKYVLDGKVGIGKTGTTQMEPEAFYDAAKDADYIIYVWSMGGKPQSLADVLAKSSVLSEMKAVRENNVFCTTPDFFQISNTLGDMVGDINRMLNSDGSQDKFTYLVRLK